MSDRRFLRLICLFFFMTVGVSGFTMHLIPLLTDSGMTQLGAAGTQSLLGIAVICGRLTTGAAVDHFFAPRVAALSMALTVCGFIAFATGGLAFAPLLVIGIGIALGTESDLIGYLTARYYRMDGYSQLYGVLYSSYLLANGVSPLFIALLVDRFGTYEPALWICASFGSVAILLLLTAPPFPESAILVPMTPVTE